VSRVVVNEIQAKVGNDISFNDAAKIDTLKGKTTAGSITVQGEGSATTNLQQGLIKFWLNIDGQSTISTRDSFNISGVVDEGEGQYTPSYSNSMGNANYSMGCNTDYDGIEYSINCKVIATGSHKIQTVDADMSSYHDHDIVMVNGMGDLA